jgi:hypothetical protein
VIVTGTLPYFSGKNPSGIAGNGVSTTWFTPRHGIMTAAPPWILRSFLIFYDAKSCCVHFETRPRPFSRQHSIYLWSRGLIKLFYLTTDGNAFFYLNLHYEWEVAPY